MKPETDSVEVEHSPLPWEGHADLIWSPKGKSVIAAMCEPHGSKFVSYCALSVTSPDFKMAMADRDLILTAVNSHSALTRENAALRQRLFGNRQVNGCDHSTACSIWGDDGQGHAEGFDALPPCNCGALINWEKKQRGEVQAELGVADNEIVGLQAACDTLIRERDALREALGSFAYSYDERDKGNPCWCYADSFDPKLGQQDNHLPKCQFARAALAAQLEDETEGKS